MKQTSTPMLTWPTVDKRWKTDRNKKKMERAVEQMPAARAGKEIVRENYELLIARG